MTSSAMDEGLKKAAMDVAELKKQFKEAYGQEPTLMVRCPGRVNLIGEHVDYSDYSVLPMAIKDSTYVLAAPTTGHLIHLKNADSTVYEGVQFDLNKPLWEGVSKPKWFDYYMCGWKGIIDYLQVPPLGMDIFVAGTVPPSAGLSSSSSVVCAAALATLAIHTSGKTFDVISKVGSGRKAVKWVSAGNKRN
uniref:Galactokinase n=1 Tax=Steinernema glaseri TaxID=37863 RepID=A0A1I7ZPY6_9BILA